jgi:DNA-binding transcriptional LysR family regulator
MDRLDTHLRYFYEAAKFGSMRAAADKLGVAASSISRQIAQLEAAMGLSLIEHGRRTIKLTEAGELAVSYYRERLDQQEAFEARLIDLKRMRTGRIELAIADDLFSGTMSAVLSRFITRYAGLSLIVRTAGGEELIRMVAEDEAHLGLVLHAHDDPRLRARVSIPAPLMAVMTPDHALAGRHALRLADIAESRLCLTDSSLRVRQILRRAETDENVLLEPSLTTNSISLVKEMVLSGEFVSVLPHQVIRREIERGQLVSVAIENPILRSITISLVSRSGRQLPIAASRLLSALEAHLNTWLEAFQDRRAG